MSSSSLEERLITGFVFFCVVLLACRKRHTGVGWNRHTVSCTSSLRSHTLVAQGLIH